MARPSISVKLSAIHPRFDPGKEERLARELLPRIVELAAAARLVRPGPHHRCGGAGPARSDARAVCRRLHGSRARRLAGPRPRRAGLRQARDPRAALAAPDVRATAASRFRCGWSRAPTGTARSSGRRSAGLPDYPVLTRKLHTDVSYLACLRLLLSDRHAFYPQFATHNAQSIAAVSVAAPASRRLRVPAPARHGRGGLRGGGRQRQAGRALPHLCAGRARTRIWSRISCGACWRTAPIRPSSTAWPTRKRRSRRSCRDPVATVEARKGTRQAATDCCRGRRRCLRRSEPTAAAWRWISPPCATTLAARHRGRARRPRSRRRRSSAARGARGQGAELVLCPHDRRQRIGTVHAADAAAIETAIASARAAAHAWDRLRRAGARRDPGARRRPLRARSRAADGGDGARGRQDAGERAGRRARGHRLPALLRGGGAAAVCAVRSRSRGRRARPTPSSCGAAVRLRASVRGIFRWRSSRARWRRRLPPAIRCWRNRPGRRRSSRSSRRSCCTRRACRPTCCICCRAAAPSARRW